MSENKQNRQKAGTPSHERLGSQDSRYAEAAVLVRVHKRVGLHFLQTRMNIGYMRAALLLKDLERNGVIGPYVEGQPRVVNQAPGENMV